VLLSDWATSPCRCLVTLHSDLEVSPNDARPTHTVEISRHICVLDSQCCADTRAETLSPYRPRGLLDSATKHLARLAETQGESLSRWTGGNEVRGRMPGFTLEEQIVHCWPSVLLRSCWKATHGLRRKALLDSLVVLRSRHAPPQRWQSTHAVEDVRALRCARVQCNGCVCQTSLPDPLVVLCARGEQGTSLLECLTRPSRCLEA